MTRKESARRNPFRRGESKPSRRAGFVRGSDVVVGADGSNRTFNSLLDDASLRVGTFDIFNR